MAASVIGNCSIIFSIYFSPRVIFFHYCVMLCCNITERNVVAILEVLPSLRYKTQLVEHRPFEIPIKIKSS